LERIVGFKKLPGLLLVAILATLAKQLADLEVAHIHGLSLLTLSIILGLLIGSSLYGHIAIHCHQGVGFAKQILLRMGIVLFGFKLTLADVWSVGWQAIVIDLLTLCSTFILSYWVGHRWLRMEQRIALLIGSGSAICGAAAVLATQPVIKAKSEHATVAIATVVVYGTLAMFIWPVLFPIAQQLGINAQQFGVFEGSTIHEIAQVAVAAQSIDDAAAKSAIITKMIRVMMLAPFLISLAIYWKKLDHSHHPDKQIPTTPPWFALAFLLMIGLNSLHWLPTAAQQFLSVMANILLACAMVAMGLTTHLSAIGQAGLRPLALAAVLWMWLLLGGGLINMGIQHFA
jgi:uncharacterized integral membrane protein (TIGR00698 family)